MKAGRSDTCGYVPARAGQVRRAAALVATVVAVACLVPRAGADPVDGTAEILVPHAGGALPPEALAPPDDVVVKLWLDPAATSPRTATVDSTPHVVLERAAGPPPWEALSHLQGVVVKLRKVSERRAAASAASSPIGSAASEATAAGPSLVRLVPRGPGVPPEALAAPEDGAVALRIGGRGTAVSTPPALAGDPPAPLYELVLAAPDDGLPPEALSPPENTIVRLVLDAGARGADAASSLGSEPGGEAPGEVAEEEVLVLPYAGGPLPAEALNPPDDVVVKLRLADE